MPILGTHAEIDVHDEHITIRVMNEAFVVPRDVDPSVEVIALKIQVQARLREGTEITPIERAAIRAFEDEHISYHGAETRFKLHFGVGGGIGTTVKVRCVPCGLEKNVTDYDSW